MGILAALVLLAATTAAPPPAAPESDRASRELLLYLAEFADAEVDPLELEHADLPSSGGGTDPARSRVPAAPPPPATPTDPLRSQTPASPPNSPAKPDHAAAPADPRPH